MPWYILLYLTSFLLLLGFSIWDNVKGRESFVYIACDLIGDLAAILFIIAYWISGVADRFALVLPILFAYSVTWLAYSIPYELKKEFADPELSPEENKSALVVSSIFSTLLVGPAYVWGLMVSLQQIQRFYPVS
jgi:hypothetical protein